MTNAEKIAACSHEWVRNGNNETGPLKRCKSCKTSRRAHEALPVIRQAPYERNCAPGPRVALARLNQPGGQAKC